MPPLAPESESGISTSSPATTPETAVDRVLELVPARIPTRFGLDPIRGPGALSDEQGRGWCAVVLNELQKVLNPAGPESVSGSPGPSAPGDKVMQIHNDYDKDVYNGDVGYPPPT